MGCKWIEATEVSRLRANPPVLKLADLTEKEAALYRDWRAEGYHEFDCLRWIEGQRYEPIRDAEFLKDAREQFRKWREECAENMLGPLPEWMQRKLAGTPVQTNDEQERFFKLWKEKHP